jgi:cytochrome c-type biogenesis protein CcmH/NrfG
MWENEKYQISIENPLSVKYLDKKIYQQRLAASEVKEADRVVEKEQFLQQF